jgi:hypothetical protein
MLVFEILQESLQRALHFGTVHRGGR